MVKPQNFTMNPASRGISIVDYNFGGFEDLESIDEDVREDDIRIQKRELLGWVDEKLPLMAQVKKLQGNHSSRIL